MNNEQQPHLLFSDPRSNKSKEIVVKKKKRHIASASTALLFGSILGLLQASVLIFGAKPLLYVMGVKHVSLFMLEIISLHNL